MDGVDIIKKERERQIHEEGWFPEHDDKHVNGELALAACTYAMPRSCDHFAKEFFKLTGWDADWFRCNYANTDSVIRNLAKAGALIAAEIDRLNRKKIKDEDS